jgi:glycosyltransferase involved in cell wall biosynthesis
MVATVTPQKGHDVLLRALKDLRIDRTVRVRIAGSATFGDHAYLELLRLMTDEVNRSDVPITVEMLGHRNDVHVLMGDSDVLVAPSRVGEGMGQVLVQARAAGLPVIASDIPGYRDLVTPGVNGLLVPDGDHSAFASAMRMIALGSVILHPSLGDGLLVGFDESVTNESISRLLAEVSP